MRFVWYFVFSFLMLGCTELIDPPAKLLPKKQMAEIIAELALTDQLNNFIPGTNTENAARFVLKEQKIKAAEFNDSYKYYLATGELDAILNEAQEVIRNRDPQAADYIRKKIQENKNAPPFER